MEDSWNSEILKFWNSDGVGASQKQKAKLEFPEGFFFFLGGGGGLKGEVWIFSGTTHWHFGTATLANLISLK